MGHNLPGRMTRPVRLLTVPAIVAVVAVACADVSGPVWVDALFLEPDSLYLVPGETAQFTSLPVDQRQRPLPERAERTEWSVSSTAIATIDATGGTATVTGMTPGTANVRVALGRGSGVGRVYVEPAELAEIRIEPSNIELAPGGGGFTNRVTVRSVLIGLDGNEVSPEGYRISWATSNTDVFIMVGRQQVVTGVSTSVAGREAGQATLTLAVGDRRVSTPIIVR